MQNADTTAPTANEPTRSSDLLVFGLALIACAAVSLISASIASSKEASDLWAPASVALSLSLIPPLFIAGLFLSAIAVANLSRRTRRIVVPTMLMLLSVVWYPLSGHDVLALYLHTQEMAFLFADQRYCALPITDL